MENVKKRYFNRLSAVVKPLPVEIPHGHLTKQDGDQIDLFWVSEQISFFMSTMILVKM